MYDYIIYILAYIQHNGDVSLKKKYTFHKPLISKIHLLFENCTFVLSRLKMEPDLLIVFSLFLCHKFLYFVNIVSVCCMCDGMY